MKMTDRQRNVFWEPTSPLQPHSCLLLPIDKGLTMLDQRERSENHSTGWRGRFGELVRRRYVSREAPQQNHWPSTRASLGWGSHVGGFIDKGKPWHEGEPYLSIWYYRVTNPKRGGKKGSSCTTMSWIDTHQTLSSYLFSDLSLKSD